jgi:hypothetical protein
MLPVHLKPLNDEILSSWLVRLAMAHGMKVHTFCSNTLSGKAIWNRDIDKCADKELVEILSNLTGASIEKVVSTILVDFEGSLYEKHNKFGPTPWILPIGVYHRKRIHFGMQFCSFCLSEDKVPYFRRKWRLVFMVICEKHKVPLEDRCPACKSPIIFHRNELGNFHKLKATSLTTCYSCQRDLRHVPKNFEVRSSIEREALFVKKLLQTIEDGFFEVSKNNLVHSTLFFVVLHQIMKILAKNDKRVIKLKEIITKEANSCPYNLSDLTELNHKLDIQEQPIYFRRQLLFFAAYLLNDWSSKFVQLSTECKIWSSLWLRNMDGSQGTRSQIAPFWFWSVIHEHLCRKRYNPTSKEIEETIKYLGNNQIPQTKSSVSRLLGAVYLRSL